MVHWMMEVLKCPKLRDVMNDTMYHGGVNGGPSDLETENLQKY